MYLRIIVLLNNFGHIARKDEHNLEQLMSTGKVESIGQWSRGRIPTKWCD